VPDAFRKSTPFQWDANATEFRRYEPPEGGSREQGEFEMSDKDKPKAPTILNSAVDMTDVAEVEDDEDEWPTFILRVRCKVTQTGTVEVWAEDEDGAGDEISAEDIGWSERIWEEQGDEADDIELEEIEEVY